MSLIAKDVRKIDPVVLEETLKILENYFDKTFKINSAYYLSNLERRNAILRINLDDTSLPASVILKQSLPEKKDSDDKQAFARFSRDWAGLEFISNLEASVKLVPQFYGGNKEHRFILIEDLGNTHISLVDTLTGNDIDIAKKSILHYMETLGQFHGLAHKHIDWYKQILHSLNHELEPKKNENIDKKKKVANTLKKLSLSISSALEAEIDDIYRIVNHSRDFSTLRHGDICPDNVFYNHKQNKIHIIDFEWSFVANALLDAVYLRMCMPTCWCVRAFPENIIEDFEPIYRRELIKNIPAAGDDQLYYESYVAACGYYILEEIIYVKDVLAKEVDVSKHTLPHPKWKIEYNISRPRILYRLKVFVAMAEKYEIFPHLRTLVEDILKELEIMWADTKQLESYNAFL